MTPRDLDRLNETMVAGFEIPNSRPGKPVESAMLALPRHTFLPLGDPASAYVDDAVVTQRDPVSGEATSSCSQPSLVATMLYQLDLRPGLRVLEVGTGTGYNAAIMALVVRDPSLVWTVDIDDAVSASARESLRIVGLASVNAQVADGWHGVPSAAPFDRMIVTAAAHQIPSAWSEQLAEDGVLVVPFGHGPFQYAYALRKQGDCLVQESRVFCGFMRMRGAEGVVEPVDRQVDPQWKSQTSRIAAGSSQVMDLHLLTAMHRWDTHFGPFLTPDNQASYGYFDPVLRTAWQVALDESRAPLGIQGWGPDGFIEEIAGPVRMWIAGGCPGFRLTVCPPGRPMDLGAGQRRIKGQSMDYIFSQE